MAGFGNTKSITAGMPICRISVQFRLSSGMVGRMFEPNCPVTTRVRRMLAMNRASLKVTVPSGSTSIKGRFKADRNAFCS